MSALAAIMTMANTAAAAIATSAPDSSLTRSLSRSAVEAACHQALAVDVAKDAADIILLRQDLGALDRGIIEGRRAFGNIMKFIMMAMSSNFSKKATIELRVITKEISDLRDKLAKLETRKAELEREIKT